MVLDKQSFDPARGTVEARWRVVVGALKGENANPSQLFRFLKPSTDDQGKKTSSWRTVKSHFDNVMAAFKANDNAEARTSGSFAAEFGDIAVMCQSILTAEADAVKSAQRRRSLSNPAYVAGEELRAAQQRSLDAQQGAPQGTIGRAHANLQARRRSQGNREGTGEDGGEGGGERRPDPQDERPQQRARVGVRGAQRAQVDSSDSVRESTVAMRDVSDRQQHSETNAKAHRAQVATNMANTLMAGMNQILQNQLTMQQNQQNHLLEMMRMMLQHQLTMQQEVMRMRLESQEWSFQLNADLVRGRQPQGQEVYRSRGIVRTRGDDSASLGDGSGWRLRGGVRI